MTGKFETSNFVIFFQLLQLCNIVLSQETSFIRLYFLQHQIPIVSRTSVISSTSLKKKVYALKVALVSGG